MQARLLCVSCSSWFPSKLNILNGHRPTEGASWPYQIYLSHGWVGQGGRNIVSPRGILGEICNILQPRNNAVMTGNITTLRYLVDEVGVKTLNSDCKGYSPLQMAVVWGQHGPQDLVYRCLSAFVMVNAFYIFLHISTYFYIRVIALATCLWHKGQCCFSDFGSISTPVNCGKLTDGTFNSNRLGTQRYPCFTAEAGHFGVFADTWRRTLSLDKQICGWPNPTPASAPPGWNRFEVSKRFILTDIIDVGRGALRQNGCE